MQTLFFEGSLEANLEWKQQHLMASEAVERGEKLFCHLDLGLFSSLLLPLDDQTQYRALRLSLEYFRDTFWTAFQDHIDGLLTSAI